MAGSSSEQCSDPPPGPGPVRQDSSLQLLKCCLKYGNLRIPGLAVDIECGFERFRLEKYSPFLLSRSTNNYCRTGRLKIFVAGWNVICSGGVFGL